MGKAERQGVLSRLGCRFELLSSSVCCIILIVLMVVIGLIGMGVIKIVVGAVYFKDCDQYELIPPYLLASGFAAFLIIGLSEFKPSADEKEWKFKDKLNVLGIVGLIGTGFYFLWMFLGCAWVFGNFSDIIDNCPGSTDCCNKDLIKFALFTLIVDLIVCVAFVIGLVLLVACCCCAKKKPNFHNAGPPDTNHHHGY